MWFERLELEHDNMRAALSWAIERGERRVRAAACGSVVAVLVGAGYFDEGRRRLEEGTGEGRRSDDDADKGAGWSWPAGERTG